MIPARQKLNYPPGSTVLVENGVSMRVTRFGIDPLPPTGLPDLRPLPSSPKPLLASRIPSPLAQLTMAFTPKQRAELEHQVLLTKYLVANVQIPSELLQPLGTHGVPNDHFATKSTFHNPLSIRDMMASSGNGSTPAPQHARCLRTDGKKWQCKKAVVRGQKYCEKHMHRGRHRALNKKVEGIQPASNQQKDASGDSRSDSPSSQDRSKGTDSQQHQAGSEEGPAKRTKLEKRTSVNSKARPGGQQRDKAALPQQTRSPALPQSLSELSARYPNPALPMTSAPVGQAGFRELYSAPYYNLPGPRAPAPASNLMYPFANLGPADNERIQDLLERSLGKPDYDNVGIPSLSSQVFSNGHAAAFASTRINRDGTMVPDTNAEMAMAMLLREERAKLDREAIAAGLGYRGVPSNYMDPRDHSIRLQFEDYRGMPPFQDFRSSVPFDAYRPGSGPHPTHGWMQPQVSPSSPSQWQLATSALERDLHGAGRLARSFSRDAVGSGMQHQAGMAGGMSPKNGSLQRQGSEPLARLSLQRQLSDPLTLAGNGMKRSGDSSPEGLPPHLAFLAQNNNASNNMQPIDEERGLVRTHSLVKGGSLANRHGQRSMLSRQPSLQSDDPEKPWLAVSTGLGSWENDVGGPLGEALRRTASGTPVQPEEKPGEKLLAGEPPSSEFGMLNEQFVVEPLEPELASRSDVPDATGSGEDRLQSDQVLNKDFQPFSLDGESESPKAEREALDDASLKDFGQGDSELKV
ncbi:QLQ domain containing protein [Klebsormidium nitens]|uniref:Growth-regulating factor n=1 Tax=Klebsormidium nitens TaxID=105231 RepID=A0A1Y1I327_KLENI|nr:QLQ domain containing protein [Klebsormidium nitens]|eukprot:GAQ84362.1 QLQ domain containing protein [Klebsormidium nitens]